MEIEPNTTRVRVAATTTAFAATALIAMLTFGAAVSSAASACPNEAIRAEQGTALSLPDCRAYESVSPTSSPLVGVNGEVAFGVRAAADGNGIAYFSYYPFAGATSSGFFYRSSRGVTGWSAEAMSPQTVPGAAPQVACEPELDYSDDLSVSVLRLGREIKQELPKESFCSRPREELVPGEPVGFANLYLRAGLGAPHQLVNITPTGAAPANAQFQDGSADLSHVVFGEEAQLTPEAPPGYNLYEWVDGALRLVTFLPDGTPVRGDLAGAAAHTRAEPGGQPVAEGGTFIGSAPFTNAVSADGERVLFYAKGNLYLRVNAGRQPTASGECSELEPALACTLRVDASRGLGPSGGGVFQYASADGKRVFFTAESELTFPSSAEPNKPDLYEYDPETDELTDLTAGGAEAANVRGFSGASEDGSDDYFVARGALTGEQANSQGAVAQPKQPNLYLAHDGALTFIATLDPAGDLGAWGIELTAQEKGPPQKVGGAFLATRTSPNGRFLAFNSVRSLTGAGGPRQIFLYDAVSGELSCASCLLGGAAPPGPTAIPEPIVTGEGQAPGYLPRGLTDSGQLFFTTSQSLVSADSDGVADVYEFDAPALRLLSDGVGAGPSFLFDASAGGNDVFFATADPLVRADTNNAMNLYDARVGGGFTEPPLPPPACAGDGCRGAGSSPPAVGATATATFAGAGNPKPSSRRCGKGKVRRHGRCVKPHAGKKGRASR